MINISKERTWTRPRTVPIIAYLDWLRKPTTEKKMLDNSTKTRWYRIIESMESTINILGPQTKFKEKRSCVANSSDKKTGAITDEGRGIKNISLVNILKRSANI